MEAIKALYYQVALPQVPRRFSTRRGLTACSATPRTSLDRARVSQARSSDAIRLCDLPKNWACIAAASYGTSSPTRHSTWVWMPVAHRRRAAGKPNASGSRLKPTIVFSVVAA